MLICSMDAPHLAAHNPLILNITLYPQQGGTNIDSSAEEVGISPTFARHYGRVIIIGKEEQNGA